MDLWYETLSERDQAAVRNAVKDPKWRHIDLQHELVEEGAPDLADTTFGAWRRRKAAEWA